MTVSETPDPARSDGDVVLEVRDVTVSFEMTRGESRVLNDVDVDLRRNEILGVVGESGSGKSMFADSLLNAVLDPGVVTGSITYYPGDGEPVDVLDLDKGALREYRWEDVSMVFQGAMSSFNPVRTIRQHFVETLTAHDVRVDEGLDRASELLSDLYLDPERVLDSYPHELSGGMKQRALIALSLILEPEVLVMDEPTAALDLLMQRSIISLIEDLKEKYGLTIVFITHDLPLIAGLADRIAVLYAFEFVEVGPAHEVLGEAVHPYTRALLKSTPNLRAPLSEMRPIGGSSPDPISLPEGCSYRPRCPLASDLCLEDPGAYVVDEEHDVRCHHWTDAAAAIPVELDAPESGTTSEPPGDGTTSGPPGDGTTSGPPGDAATSPSRPNTSSAEPVVTLDDVEVHFETGGGGILDFSEPDTVAAVDGVSLDIYESDVVVLVGESGCGKTTLGKTAIGLQKPTGGTVSYRGQDVWRAKQRLGDIDIPFHDIRRALQIIHQDPGGSLNAHRTVKSILQDPLKRWNKELNVEDRLQRILGMLEYVGMTPPEDYVERYPHQLSGGEKQRVALVRALLMSPDVILADEAVSALDVSLRVEMMDLMIELQEVFDTSYVFVSHNLSNARYLAGKTGGRIGVMYLGELVEIGPPERVVHDPQHPYTQALEWATPELDPALEARAGDPPMRKIDIPDPSDPPSGCRYHTRCGEAREVCRTQTPPAYDLHDAGGAIHRSACFRTQDDHEYWDSEPIED